MLEPSAFVYASIVAGVCVFQGLLVAGAPWAHLTQGGRHSGSLPRSGRAAAALSVLVLLFMAGSVTSAAGLAPHWSRWTLWITLGLQALSTLLNWITPSRPERRLWGPVTTVMLSLAVFVAYASS